MEQQNHLLANLHIQLHEPADIEGDLDDHQDRIKVRVLVCFVISLRLSKF
jgi:hypothetical protein